ncbi:unnamed protein product [Clonostachys rhizophaga]|uniref:Uncharacterized protein n=1 Tax=Clonostachys rhizophaga TaxID=160324 RepID=A0A9N9VA32_9HYPO|nr:unnamed protein product [Clonostachys rhizophaga]
MSTSSTSFTPEMALSTKGRSSRSNTILRQETRDNATYFAYGYEILKMLGTPEVLQPRWDQIYKDVRPET